MPDVWARKTEPGHDKPKLRWWHHVSTALTLVVCFLLLSGLVHVAITYPWDSP